jgi:hypothetical protein
MCALIDWLFIHSLFTAHFGHDRYPGVPHGFYSMFPEMTATKKWDADFDEGVKWVLEFSL